EIYTCASLLQQHATALTTIRIVKGGFQLFSKLYPFLRTSQSLYSPKVKFTYLICLLSFDNIFHELELIQTYPNEICPNLVYLGRRQHAVNSQIVKDLKIRAYVNCTTHEDYLVQGDDTRKYCRVSIDDVHDADNIFELLHNAVNFISVAYDRGDPVLVYSDRGVSRSAAVIVAFISFQMRMSSQQALKYVEEHRPIRPQQSFIACIDNLNEKLQELKEAMSNANQISIDADADDEQASH
ncbi:unnamed protein product, partial [Rotaria magnacalcarata]